MHDACSELAECLHGASGAGLVRTGGSHQDAARALHAAGFGGDTVLLYASMRQVLLRIVCHATCRCTFS